MKCRNCPKTATLHITEVEADDRCDQLHFCEDCGRRYLSEPPADSQPLPAPEPLEEEASLEPNPSPCGECGIKFVEFRNSGRLGCPNDYDAFREELLPLLESIHGDVKHAGKVPRRKPARAADLGGLRKLLLRAVDEEDYEQAAKLRDRIKQAEQG